VSVIDEIRVSETGDYLIGLIPPDRLSSEAYVQVTLDADSPLWQRVREGCLDVISRQLGLHSDVAFVVHQGEDRYSVGTACGDVLELDDRRYRIAVAAIQRTAREIEASRYWPENVLPSDTTSRISRGLRLVTNVFRGTVRHQRIRYRCPSERISGAALNVLSNIRGRPAADYRAPALIAGND